MTIAKLYMEIRKGQDALDNLVWAYTGNDITKEDLDSLQSLSNHIDTITDGLLQIMNERDVKSHDGMTKATDAK